MTSLLDDLSRISNWIGDIFIQFLTVLNGLIEALGDFIAILDNVNIRVQNMTEIAKGGKISDIPIFETIGTFRYLMGDLAFYTLYMVVILGCYVTISKIGVVMWGSFTRVYNSLLPNGLSLTSIKALFTK